MGPRPTHWDENSLESVEGTIKGAWTAKVGLRSG